MESQPKRKRFKVEEIVFILSGVFFLIPNLFYVCIGWFTRLRADDFCFSGTFREYGLLKGLNVFYNTLSNRFSAFLIWSFSDLFGEKAIRFFPMFTIVLFSFSLFWAAKKVLQALKMQNTNPLAFFFSQVLTFFSLYLAPDIHQGVYWRAAMVHYFFPLPVSIIILLYIFTNPKAKNNLCLKAFILFLVSIFLAGLSESYAGLHGGVFGLIFLFWLLRKDKKDYRHLFFYSVAAMVGVLVTLLIMIVSPGNTLKFTLEDQASGLFSIISISLDSAYSFIFYSLRGLWLPSGILFMLGIFSGWIGISKNITKIQKQKIILALVFIPLVVFFLVFCISAPTAYGMMAYPEKRVLMLAMPIVLLGLFTIGNLLALLLYQGFTKKRTINLLISAAIIILSLYPFTTYHYLFDMVNLYRNRAQYWDDQQVEILQQIEQGKTELTVTALDSLSEIAEMREYDTFWVNLCVAQYYNVDTISAVER